jgi:ATP-dependent helicase/nuclease subunit A
MAGGGERRVNDDPGMDAGRRANDEQIAASDPAASVFVAASAGSGKTKLLTDRLLRLMLSGADPARIQCLTFTRAAAAEMSLRLQRRLGEWVTLPEAALDAKLRALRVEPTADARARARKLFARVLDLPGGMRIGTIHAFCQSLLRRFPLEAQISPHFDLVDDSDARVALTEAREDMLADAHTDATRAALSALAGLTGADGFGHLVVRLSGDVERLDAALALGWDGLLAAQRRVLSVSQASEDGVLSDAVHWSGEGAFVRALRDIEAGASPSIAEKARRLLEWLSIPREERAEHWSHWRDEFIRPDGDARGAGALLNKNLAQARPELMEAMLAEQARVFEVEDMRRALRLSDISSALLRLAGPVVQAYTARKDGAGLLDYADLIVRTRRLLHDPGAAWVLYKLDGGLDHLLLDEVQDTSPAQWNIANALTDEFFAGAGANEAQRTVFAVGDRKQSIYSFQGADVDAFDQAHDWMRDRVTSAGRIWRDGELDVSFRSTAPVLALVDSVFTDPTAAAGVTVPGALRHIPARAGQAGAVELWPLAPPPDPPVIAPWSVPDRNEGQTTSRQTLAETLAAWIAEQTNGVTMLASKNRPLAPRDIMVLVRRRDAFARALVRELKKRGVPVAGMDRLTLTEQPAVQDLMALADALLLPQDCLSLACVLTSPLGGLTDASLMDLALGRPGLLWDALRDRAHERADWQAAEHFLSTLLARVDYATPHALLAEALGPLGGRARLFARLGPEASEAIDELLNTALDYARLNPPALQGFLHWLRRSGAEVKREADAAGDAVRIMTVHGSKGLQAPLVILPDTTSPTADDGPLLWAPDPLTGVEVPLWMPRRDYRCQAADDLRGARAHRRGEEANRLLYVALTRAEDRLLICGWDTGKTIAPENWYPLVRGGLVRLGARAEPFAAWPGERLIFECTQTAQTETEPVAADAIAASAPPAWAGSAPDWTPAPPPPEPARPEPLAPSRPEGAALGTVPEAASPLAARDTAGKRFRRGTLIHALLQHLPDLESHRRAEAASAYLGRPGHELDAATVAAISAETLAILDHPDLAPLFGPASRAEVPLTGEIAGSVIGGLVDRLAVTEDRVLLADFKTNRNPPARVEDTPVLYLRQMAAYRAVLRAVFPEHDIACALVWTQACLVSVLPDTALDAHAPQHTA